MKDRLRFRCWNGEEFINPDYIKSGLGFWKQNSIPNSSDVEQCTGIRDKTGALIYEGGIIDLESRGGAVISPGNIVELSDFLGGHYWIVNNGNKNPIYKIVGNIHEN